MLMSPFVEYLSSVGSAIYEDPFTDYVANNQIIFTDHTFL